MRNIIFLDIDGVLNGHEEKNKMGKICGVDDDKIERLKIIAEHMHAEIILSSTWKIYWTPELASDGVNNWLGSSPKRYGRYLNIKLGEYGLKISGKTDNIAWNRRHEEILLWLENNQDIGSILILDDEQFLYEESNLGGYWISTEDQDMWYRCGEGLQDKHVEEAIKKFDSGKLQWKGANDDQTRSNQNIER